MVVKVKVKPEAPQWTSETIISGDQQCRFRTEILRLGHLIFPHHHGKCWQNPS